MLGFLVSKIMDGENGGDVWGLMYLNRDYVSVLIMVMDNFWFLMVLGKFSCFVRKKSELLCFVIFVIDFLGVESWMVE